MYSLLECLCRVPRSDGIRDDHFAVVDLKTRQIRSIEYHIFYHGQTVTVFGKNDFNKFEFKPDVSLTAAQKNEIREMACIAYQHIVESLIKQGHIYPSPSKPETKPQESEVQVMRDEPKTKPPEATTTLPIAPDFSWKIQAMPATVLPNLVCSFHFAGNKYQFYFLSDGSLEKISATVSMNGHIYNVKISLGVTYARFYLIQKNGLPVKSAFTEAEALWDMIKRALIVAEENYSPEVHHAAELDCGFSEKTIKLHVNEKINTVRLKVKRLKTVLSRISNYLSFNGSKVDVYFSRLSAQAEDCLNELKKLESEDLSEAERVDLFGVKCEYSAIMLYAHKIEAGYDFSKPSVDAPRVVILVEINETTSELVFFLKTHRASFDDQGRVTSLSFITTHENVEYRSVVTFTANSVSSVRLESLNESQIAPHLSGDEKIALEKRGNELLAEFQLLYSPQLHEAMELQYRDDMSRDQKSVVDRLHLFLNRILSYQCCVNNRNIVFANLEPDQKKIHQSRLLDYFLFFENCLKSMECEALEENKEAIMALRERYEEAYSKTERVRQALLREKSEKLKERPAPAPKQVKSVQANQQPTKETVAESEEIRRALLLEESKKSEKKRAPAAKQEKSVPAKKEKSKPALQPLSNEEKKFNKDFESINKLMDEKLIYFKKYQKTLSAELKKEIDVIKERFEALKEYYEAHALSQNERAKNKFARLEKLRGEIQTFIPAELESAQVAQENIAPPAATAELESAEEIPASTSVTNDPSEPPRSILPIDYDPPASQPPAATIALVGAQQRLLPAPRAQRIPNSWTYNPYALPGESVYRF